MNQGHMNAPMRLAGAAVVLALLAPPGHAQPKPALELAGRVYERAGIDAQIRSIPKQFEQGLVDYRGRIPDEAIVALTEAGKKSFAAEPLREEIVRTLAQKLTAADMKEALAWLDGETGRRMTLAEERAAGSMTQEAMQAYFESEKGKPEDPKRAGLIADLIQATKAVEVGATFIESISLGMAVGMDATQPVEKRIGAPGLRTRLRLAMPPERVRADVGVILPPMYRYIYRSNDDADLAAYVEFNRSPLGARYNEALTAALVGAMTRASVRVGEMLPAPPAREKI
jgi:uncharacterized protein DUF2059